MTGVSSLAKLAEQLLQLFLEPLGHVAGFLFLVVIVLVVMFVSRASSSPHMN